jgi:hypothetical protein
MRAERDLRAALIAVALIPVAFVLAMVTGDGLISMMGYGSGGQEAPPIGPMLLASTPAILILVAPASPPSSTVVGHTGPGARTPGCLPGSAEPSRGSL